ncbi:MAG: amidohydrolase family protein [Mycobacterium sp.]|uniref:amidohydrolase family protein n=1 Tax=Mycobacterium sp. TaxID=1785 RepID=UPI003CC54F70
MNNTRIDVHTHYLGGAVAHLFESGFTLTGGYRMSAQWDPATAIDFMDRHCIASQILSVPWAFTGRSGDPAFAAMFCRQVNEEYATLITDHPGRFGAFAAIPADHPDSALVEIEYALDVLGLDGVLLSSNAAGHYFGGDFYEPILAELTRRQVPGFVHPAECPHIEVLGFSRPSSIIEFPCDTARTITDAIYSGVFQRHPRLTLILAHCGGVLPTLGWRIAEHTQMGRGPHDADIDPGHVAAVLRGLYYETALAGSRNSLLPTLEVTSAEHILFGTDWPAAPEPTVAENVANLTGFTGWAEGGLAQVERANAVKLFGRFEHSVNG